MVGGAGGGGKSGSSSSGATEAPDSLRSMEIARVIDIISEGPIKGFVKPGMQSVFWQDTPVENPDGTKNFKNYSFFFLEGLVQQPYLPAFPEQESIQAEGVRVKFDTPYTRTFTDQTLNAVLFNIRFTAMTKQDPKTGNIGGSSVDLKIEINVNSGGFVPYIPDDKVAGKSKSAYERAYRVDFPAGFTSVAVRISRLTADATTSNIQNESWVNSYNLLIDAKLTFPNRALTGTIINAEQFSSIPSRAFEIYGLLINIPTNYDPVARTYATTGPGTSAGVWDGTFKIAWSNNPAWCFMDMLTNTRYGLGQFVKVNQVNKWELYAIAQECDLSVPDGFGAFEPQFTCNLVLQAAQDALKVCADMASIFNGMCYFGAGIIQPVQDRPRSPSFTFSPSNVTTKFTYTGTSRRAQASVVIVGWNDYTDLGKIKYERVEDQEAIQKFGVRESVLTGFGCWSRGQAHRIGLYKLETEKRQAETISFQTGLEGMVILPGELINIVNPWRMGAERSGRLLDATPGTTLVLDRPVELKAGFTYQVQCISETGKIETRSVTSATGIHSSLTVADYTTVPLKGTAWALIGSDLVPEVYQISAVSEPQRGTYEIHAVKYDAAKFAIVRNTPVLETPPDTVLQNPLLVIPPTNFLATQVPVATPDGYHRGIDVSWTRSTSSFVLGYEVMMRIDDDNWEREAATQTSPEITIIARVPGNYQFKIYAKTVLGGKSQALEGNIVIADTAPINPFTIENLTLTNHGSSPTDFIGKDAAFQWQTLSPAGYMGPDNIDPLFRAYIVNIYDAGTSALLQQEETTDPLYTWTYEKNQQAGLRRSFKIGVKVQNTYGDFGIETFLTVQNPIPVVVSSFAAMDSITAIAIRYAKPADLDFVGVKIWSSSSATFTPTDADPTDYVGPDTVIFLPQAPNTTRYFRIAAFDVFSSTLASGLVLSPVFAGATSSVGLGDLAVEIQDLLLQVTTNADGITALAQDVATLIAQVEDQSASVQVIEQATVDSHGNAAAKFAVVVNAAGHVAGISLISQAISGLPPTSSFTIEADLLKFVVPGQPDFPMFTVSGTAAIFGVPIMQSSGFVSGADGMGWQMRLNGDAQFQTLFIRNPIISWATALPSVSPPPGVFSAAFNVSIVTGAGTTVRYTLDGSAVTENSPEWPKVSGSYTTLPVSDTTSLTLCAFGATGGASQQGFYQWTKLSVPATPVCATPTAYKSGGYVVLACATPGAQIYFNINGGAFSLWTTQTQTPFNTSRTYGFYGHVASGYTDSPAGYYQCVPQGGGGGGGGIQP
jgi:predicted phage tail protein